MSLRLLEQPPSAFRKYDRIKMTAACNDDLSEALTNTYTYATIEVTDEEDTSYNIVGDIDTAIRGESDDGLIVFAFKNFVIPLYQENKRLQHKHPVP